MDTINKIRIARLEMLVKEHGGLRLFCEKIGRSESQVYQWLKEAPDSKTGKPRAISNASARRIEAVCGRAPGWLDQPVVHDNNNVGKLIKNGRNVPLVPWEQASEWCEGVKDMSDHQEYMICPVEHEGNVFVLEVKGISMFNPNGELSFRDGELIYIDPDKKPVHLSLVVAKVNNVVMFRQLVIEGNKRYLYALNPTWIDRVIELTENSIICGVLVFSGRKF